MTYLSASKRLRKGAQTATRFDTERRRIFTTSIRNCGPARSISQRIRRRIDHRNAMHTARKCGLCLYASLGLESPPKRELRIDAFFLAVWGFPSQGILGCVVLLFSERSVIQTDRGS